MRLSQPSELARIKQEVNDIHDIKCKYRQYYILEQEVDQHKITQYNYTTISVRATMIIVRFISTFWCYGSVLGRAKIIFSVIFMITEIQLYSFHETVLSIFSQLNISERGTHNELRCCTATFTQHIFPYVRFA